MSSVTVDKRITGELGELHVFSELLKRSSVSYVPMVGEGVDALVRTPEGSVIEIQVKATGSTGGKYPRWLQIDHIRPRKNFMTVCVKFEKGDPLCAWVFPSIILEKSASPPKGSPRDLDLESSIGNHAMPI